MSKHELLPTSGWMLCALGKPLAHRVSQNAVWIPYCDTFAYATVCGHVAKPADPEVVDTYQKCPDCAAPCRAWPGSTRPYVDMSTAV